MTPAGPRRDEMTPCRKCGDMIMFLRSHNQQTGKSSLMPVNVAPTDRKYRAPNSGETEYVSGQHQPHWGTCSDPDSFRSRR